MTDWNSPEELQRDGVIFSKFIHALLGLYAMEWFLSLDFEWDFICGKKKFRWPMIFYFANRYLMLFTLIGVTITLDAVTQINCQALYTVSQLAGDASVGLASINLAIRTMSIWSQNRYIIGFLTLVILGHWSLILQGIQLKAAWIPGTGCAITEFDNKIFTAIFIYSMCFDFIVLLLSSYKLAGLRWNSQTMEKLNQSRLSRMIFSDGLIYFFIAFIANLLATVFMLLNLNQVMGIMFNAPAAIFSTIAACRTVRRLKNYSEVETQVSNKSNSTGTIFFKKRSRLDVHVKMETFTQKEDQNNDSIFKSKSGRDKPDVDGILNHGSLV